MDFSFGSEVNFIVSTDSNFVDIKISTPPTYINNCLIIDVESNSLVSIIKSNTSIDTMRFFYITTEEGNNLLQLAENFKFIYLKNIETFQNELSDFQNILNIYCNMNFINSSGGTLASFNPVFLNKIIFEVCNFKVNYSSLTSRFTNELILNEFTNPYQDILNKLNEIQTNTSETKNSLITEIGKVNDNISSSSTSLNSEISKVLSAIGDTGTKNDLTTQIQNLNSVPTDLTEIKTILGNSSDPSISSKLSSLQDSVSKINNDNVISKLSEIKDSVDSLNTSEISSGLSENNEKIQSLISSVENLDNTELTNILKENCQNIKDLEDVLNNVDFLSIEENLFKNSEDLKEIKNSVGKVDLSDIVKEIKKCIILSFVNKNQ